MPPIGSTRPRSVIFTGHGDIGAETGRFVERGNDAPSRSRRRHSGRPSARRLPGNPDEYRSAYGKPDRCRARKCMRLADVRHRRLARFPSSHLPRLPVELRAFPLPGTTEHSTSTRLAADARPRKAVNKTYGIGREVDLRLEFDGAEPRLELARAQPQRPSSRRRSRTGTPCPGRARPARATTCARQARYRAL